MNRDRILVVGANGALGQEVLAQLGPTRAIAVTRIDAESYKGFENVTLMAGATLDPAVLQRCNAVINAAGRIKGSDAEFAQANVKLPLHLAEVAREAGVASFIQTSSFSVYGATELIGAASEIAPINAYGRSKAAGDSSLLSLSNEAFSVECLRLPLLFSRGKPGLLAPLLKLARSARFLPVIPRRPVSRSMITYRDAAAQLIAGTARGKTGVTHAADPQTFDFVGFARMLREIQRVEISLLAAPPWVASALVKLVPPVGRRVFQSSVLDPASNCAGDRPLGLETEIRSWLAGTDRQAGK